MNISLKRRARYQANINALKNLVGLNVNSAIRELYFYDDTLFEESMGALELMFSDGKKLTFDCHADAESLEITQCGPIDRPAWDEYHWEKTEFISQDRLSTLGKIVATDVEWLHNKQFGIPSTSQNGCRLVFKNGDFLYLWTEMSDNFFYELNRAIVLPELSAYELALERVSTF